MGADDNPAVEAAERHRVRRTLLFYRNLISHAKELGEIARIEIEIQNRFPHAASPPRCPRWHDHSSPHGRDAPR
jgi:hypothetical protein